MEREAHSAMQKIYLTIGHWQQTQKAGALFPSKKRSGFLLCG